MFQLGGNIAVLSRGDAGLLAAAEAFAARAPYVWKVPGNRMGEIADAADAAARLEGVTYLKGKTGIRRAFFRGQKAVAKEALDAAVAAGRRSACKWMNVAGISSSGRTRNFA